MSSPKPFPSNKEVATLLAKPSKIGNQKLKGLYAILQEGIIIPVLVAYIIVNLTAINVWILCFTGLLLFKGR